MIKRVILKRGFLLLFSLAIFINLFLAAWYVLHDDIILSADIARDFSLFKEIDAKKIILIGPRSSVSSLFHGPLWLYLNYPAYLLGKGDPVVVGYYWVFLTIIFLIASFIIAKDSLIGLLAISMSYFFQSMLFFILKDSLTHMVSIFFCLCFIFYWLDT